MTEAQLEKKVVELLIQHGFLTIKADMLKRGWPDRIAFGPTNRVFLLEFKTQSGKLSAMQKRTHREFEARGFQVQVVRDLESVQEMLDSP